MGFQLLDAASESDARERREAAKDGGQSASAVTAAEAASRRKALANAAKQNATSRYCAGVVHGARIDTVVAFAAGKNQTHQVGKHPGLIPYGDLVLDVDAVAGEVGRVVSMARSMLLAAPSPTSSPPSSPMSEDEEDSEEWPDEEDIALLS
eukprot:1033734-Prymnesium_polylepis.1